MINNYYKEIVGLIINQNFSLIYINGLIKINFVMNI